MTVLELRAYLKEFLKVDIVQIDASSFTVQLKLGDTVISQVQHWLPI